MQNFRALGAQPPNPKNSPPIANFWLRVCERRFPIEIGEKSASFLGRPFFWSLLIYLPEKNLGRGSFPQC